jgi:hypothetical protein
VATGQQVSTGLLAASVAHQNLPVLRLLDGGDVAMELAPHMEDRPHTASLLQLLQHLLEYEWRKTWVSGDIREREGGPFYLLVIHCSMQNRLVLCLF